MAEPDGAGDDRGMKQTSFASLEYAGKKRKTALLMPPVDAVLTSDGLALGDPLGKR